MVSLRDVLVQELDKYTGIGANALLLPLYDDNHRHYGIAILDYPNRDEPADMLILARIIGDKILIEEDMTDKKLVDALLQQGIPREQIVLIYEGESIPETHN